MKEFSDELLKDLLHTTLELTKIRAQGTTHQGTTYLCVENLAPELFWMLATVVMNVRASKGCPTPIPTWI